MHAQPESIDPAAPQVAPPEESRKRTAAAWVISLCVHVAVLVVATLLVFGSRALVQDAPPLRTAAISPPEKKPEPERKPRAVISETSIPTEVDSNVAPVSDLTVPPDVPSQESDVPSEVSQGREEAVASAETGGASVFMAIGVASNSSGMFGNRGPGGRKRAVGIGGGSRQSEAAVESGLRWFTKHQAPNGSWPLLTYQGNCTDGAKCEPAERHRGPSDDIGVTSLAVLCFLGAGYDHRTPNPHRQTVRKAIDWLLSLQDESGEWRIEGARAHNYAQAMAVMALSEAYGLTSDPALRKPAENGIQVMLKRRVPATAAGGHPWVWGDGQESDAGAMASSSTSWNIQALKAAIGAGLAVGDGWESGKQWLAAIWEASVRAEGKDPARLDPYRDETGIAYRYNPQKGEVTMFRGEAGPDKAGTGRGIHDLGCVGLLCGIFQGRPAGDPLIETIANYEMKYHVPTSYPMNNYYVYYNTLSMFQLQGERWRRWNASVRDLLVGSQRNEPGSCFDGSWDPGTHYSAKETGRPLATALNTLTLEVYYRYELLHGSGGRKRIQLR